MKPSIRTAFRSICLAAFALSTGCVQLHTNIKVEQDGGATVTERLRFSRDVLDLGGDEMEKLLSKDAAMSRAGRMGSGLKLHSHKVVDAAAGSREALAVFKISDINNLIYASPFFSNRDYIDSNAIGFKMYPVYQSTWFGHKAGELAIGFKKLNSTDHLPAKEKRYPKDENPPKPPTPADEQALRELGMVFNDMLQGFELKLTVESFSGVRTGFGYRDSRAGTKVIDLLHISDRNLDKFGFSFLQNEELILSLLKGEFGAPVVIEQIKGWASNKTLPVYHPWGAKDGWWVARREIFFAPSKHMFTKYFVGKELDFAKGGKRTADFAKDGWQGN